VPAQDAFSYVNNQIKLCLREATRISFAATLPQGKAGYIATQDFR
jgi:hypothetical protein